ncbi:MAG: PP2C family serine/threonine-protein phosphatase [Alphaproteobacteria bacterium]
MNPSQNDMTPEQDFILGQAGELPLHVFQAQGPRPDQQDNLCVFVLKNPISEQRMAALFKVMAEATNAPELASMNGGTTANLVAVSRNKIIAANLGDSLTTLFTKKAAGSYLEAVSLSRLHITADQEEAERLDPLHTPEELFINRSRIMRVHGDRHSSLAMTRALGDHQFAPMVIQEPTIFTHDINPDEFVEVQLAAYTDGVTDTHQYVHYDLKFDAELLAQIAQNVQSQSEESMPMATVLAIIAMNAGLADNAAAISVDLKALDENTHLLIGVFDGHAPEGRRMTELAIEALESQPDLTM